MNNDSLEILVDIILHATGSAPILKQKKWAVDQEKPISAIIKFIHKYLKLEPGEKLVSHQTMIVLKILIMIFYSFSVFIHQPNVRPLAGPDHQESVRVLRGKREAGPSLCQESGLGISWGSFSLATISHFPENIILSHSVIILIKNSFCLHAIMCNNRWTLLQNVKL